MCCEMFAFSMLIKTQDESKWSCPGVQLISNSWLTGLLPSFLIFLHVGVLSGKNMFSILGNRA